jgi:ribonuclease P protein component
MKNIAITENHLYKKVYAGGKKAGGKYTVIYILKDRHAFSLKKANPQKAYVNRVGLTVTKKLGNAVVRSRVKRILRAAYAEAEKVYGVKKGWLVVISARDAAVKAKSSDVYADMIKQFGRLEMLSCDEPQCKSIFEI